jgi:hypothetical protein
MDDLSVPGHDVDATDVRDRIGRRRVEDEAVELIAISTRDEGRPRFERDGRVRQLERVQRLRWRGVRGIAFRRAGAAPPLDRRQLHVVEAFVVVEG